jgi:hypothetical protein
MPPQSLTLGIPAQNDAIQAPCGIHAAAAPEKLHLSHRAANAVILNPLTIFPARPHARPRTPSLQVLQKVTMAPVKLHLTGRNPLPSKAVRWR